MSEEQQEEKKLPNMKESLMPVYEALTAPFPDEALSTDSSRGFDLTSVKAQYVKERLNEVLGFTNWRLDGQYEEVDGGILYQGRLTLFLGDFACFPDGGPMTHYVEALGFSAKKKNIGDTYKSAQTDALSKAVSNIGVANDVFKGKVAPPSKKKAVAAKQPTTKPSSFKGKSATKVSGF